MSRAPDSPDGNALAVLDTLDRDALSAAWRRIVKTPAPKGISRGLLVQIWTYEAQVQQRGWLTPAVRHRLDRWPPAGPRPHPNTGAPALA